jgi:hypothetical protein
MRCRYGLVIMVAVSMTACQQTPAPGRNPRSPTVGAPAPTPTPTIVPRLLTGSFDAISTTAMGITGDLTLTPSTMTFSQGLEYETMPAASVRASTTFAKSGSTWVELLAVDAGTTIEVRAVSAERVDPRAPNGGLCRPDGTAFIALASAPGPDEAPALMMAAFKGRTKPGAEAEERALCGTFTYAPRQEH